jgi:hypothetical protein
MINYEIQVIDNETFNSYVTWMEYIIHSYNNLHVLDYN